MMRHVLLFCFFLFSVPCAKAQCLNGTYTVGGTTPDFSGTEELVAALDSFGVCGHVVFDFRNGAYDGIFLDTIVGVSDTSTITFQSESGNRSDVTINSTDWDLGSSWGDCFFIRSTGFLRVKNMTFETAGYGGGALWIEGDAQHNLFDNVLFESEGSTTPVVKFAFGQFTQTTFKDSRFENGSYPILAQDSLVDSLTVEGCEMHSLQGPFVIAKDFTFRNNKVTTAFSSTDFNFYQGVTVWAGEGSAKIENNDIETDMIGIFVHGGYEMDSLDVVNNFIHWRNGNTQRATLGIHVDNVPKTKLLFNTVLMQNPVMELEKLGEVRLFNNIFYGDDLDTWEYLWKYEEIDTLISDYNCFYSGPESTRFVSVSPVGSHSSFKRFQEATGLDKHSIFHRPEGIVDPWLGTSEINDVALNGKGLSIPGISADRSGHVRGTPPDMGCDEFDLPTLDGRFTHLDSIQTQHCEGSHPILIYVENAGTDSLKTIQVDWSINGNGQSPLVYNVNLASGDTSVALLLTNHVFERLGEYEFEVQLTELNGSTAPTSSNSTFTKTLYSSLTGTYSVGGAFSDFEGIEDATNNMYIRGICGDVTCAVEDGEYEEQLLLVDVPYVTPNSSICFKSASGNAEDVLIGGGINLFQRVVSLRGENIKLQNLTFDLHGNSTGYGHVFVLFLGACENVLVDHCVLDGVYELDKTSRLVLTAGEVRRNITFTGNVFQQTQIGIDVNHIENCTITNNVFQDFREEAINAYGLDTINLSGNVFRQSVSDSIVVEDAVAITLYDCEESITVSNNDFHMKSGTAISISDSKDTVANCAVWNNVFKQHQGVALEIGGSSNWDIYYNSFNLFPAEGYTSDAYAIQLSNCENNRIRYNVFANSTGGSILDRYIGGNFHSDYNDLYSVVDRVYTNFSGGGVDLDSWISSGNDSNSVSVDPAFLSDFDLRILRNPSLEDKGHLIAGMELDRNGVTRSANPDFGAYEIVDFDYNIGVAALQLRAKGCDSLELHASFVNEGVQAVTAFDVYVSRNDVPIDTLAWSGLLNQFEVDSGVYLMTLPFLTDSVIELQVSILDPNGQSDQYLNNNMLRDTMENRIHRYFNTYDLCFGDSVVVGNQVYTQTGIYWDTLSNVYGCDSIIQTTLNIAGPYLMRDTLQTCDGTGVEIFGQMQYDAGIYWDSLSSQGGCDSVFQTTLIVHPQYDSLLSLEICEGDSIWIGDSYKKEAGEWTISYQTVKGCDSIMTYSLQVRTVEPYYFETFAICPGDSVLVNGVYRDQPGVYLDSLENELGCDSVVLVTISWLSQYEQAFEYAICEGDSIWVMDAYRFESGTYTDSLRTGSGCDSIVVHRVILHTAEAVSQNVSICEGSDIELYGILRTEPGTYSDTLQTSYGCDSIHSTNLSVLPLPDVSLAPFEPDTLCKDGGTVPLPVGTPLGGTYTGLGTGPGTYDPFYAALGLNLIQYTVEDENGCKNSDTAYVFVEPCVGIDDLLLQDIDMHVYPNPFQGELYVEVKLSRVQSFKLSVFNAMGQEIYNQQVSSFQKGRIHLDLKDQRIGIYYVRLSNESFSMTKPVALKD